jgi:hypothetical protein
MLTLFAIPKPFRGHIGIIQRNAIQSWVRLSPRPEIILLGDDEGTAEVAQEFGLKHVPDIERNAQGTPLISSMFDRARQEGSGSLFAYVNSDIMLLNDFMKAIQQISLQRFMMCGQRCDLDVAAPIDFDSPNWETTLRQQAAAAGKLNGPWSLDYFVFPDSLYQEVPPFAIGRFYFDNWLCYEAIRSNVALIDATDAVLAIHQNHDYNHQPGGYQGIWESEEGKTNQKLIGGDDYLFFRIDLANWLMTPQGLQKPEWTSDRLSRCLEMLPLVRPELASWAALLKQLIDTQFHSHLTDATTTQIRQNLGETYFANADHWFWFSLKADSQEPITTLPKPGEREEVERLKFKLFHTQLHVEQLYSKIAAMENNKVWKLRNRLLKLKNWLLLKPRADP